MSFSYVQKGANRGLVSTYGRRSAQFPFLNFRHTAVANHKTFTQKLGITGLR
jgi:hypothetical protein